MLTSTQCVTVKLHYGLFLLTEAWHVSYMLLSLGPRTKMTRREPADNLHGIGDMRLVMDVTGLSMLTPTEQLSLSLETRWEMWEIFDMFHIGVS